MSRIGFVNVCHSDYVSGAAVNMTDAAVKALENGGINICQIKEPAVGSQGAKKAGKEKRITSKHRRA